MKQLLREAAMRKPPLDKGFKRNQHHRWTSVQSQNLSTQQSTTGCISDIVAGGQKLQLKENIKNPPKSKATYKSKSYKTAIHSKERNTKPTLNTDIERTLEDYSYSEEESKDKITEAQFKQSS